MPTSPAFLCIWDDMHNERPGYFRAFWADSPTSTIGSPAIGYCEAGGSHKTIKACVAEIRKRHPDEPIYRRGYVIA